MGNKLCFQLQQKYPLYTDVVKSIYVRDADMIKAKTPVRKSHRKMFCKDSRFTSRLSNPMDINTPVGPGHFAYI